MSGLGEDGMGGARGSSGDGTKDRDMAGAPQVDEGRPLAGEDEAREADRSPEERAEIDRKAGDVADDLADFA
jgi:hypothetical protein